jgi:phage tail tape-measure protein
MSYVDAADISIFHNNPPGQHGAPAMGGDEDEDPSAAGAGKSSATTAVSAGLAAGAIGALGGPVVAMAAAGVGAYSGSLVGAMAGLENQDDKPHPPEHRPGGIMLSVRIAEPANEERVIATLRAEGAADIERAQGEWRDGDWADFDPVAAPRLVESAAPNAG